MENLLEFLSKHFHWVLFVVLEVLSIVLLFQFNSYQNSVWFSSASLMAGKVYEWNSAVETFFSLTKVNEGLTRRNFYLERQVSQLRRLYNEANEHQSDEERQELEKLSRYKLIDAKVVSNEVHRANNLLTIDKGSKDSVEVGMGVACGQGVVGVVYLTSDHYSIVIPVLNVVAILAFCAGTVRMPAMPMWTGYPVMLVLNAVSGLRPMAIAASFLLVSWWGKSRKSITPATDCPFA